MDLKSLHDARNAVAKIAKDYQPIVNLAAALEEVEKIAGQVAELDKVLAAKNAELKSVTEQVELGKRLAASEEAKLAAAKRDFEGIKAAVAKLSAA